MKVITIGPGESCEANIDKLQNLNDDIVKLGYAQTYHHLHNRGIDFDYLTWHDPGSSLSTLKDLISNIDKGIPKIILAQYLEKIDAKQNPGMQYFLNNFPGEDKFYNEAVQELKRVGKLTILKNYIQTSDISPNHPVFEDPKIRFEGNINYIGTVPCISRASESDWARENLFSRLFLPLCFDLGATEVYNIGFDSRGLGLGRVIPQFHNNDVNIKPALHKLQTWLDWEKYHGMKIFSVAEDKYTPNNKVLPYKSLDELTTSN